MPLPWWSAFARPISTAEPSYRLAKMDRPSSEALGDEARRSGWWQRALAARRAFRRPCPAEADRGDERAPRGPRQGRPRRRRSARQRPAGRQHPAAERGIAPHRPADASRRVRRGEPGADRLPPRPGAAQRVRRPRDPPRRRMRDHAGPRRRQGSRVRQPDEAVAAARRGRSIRWTHLVIATDVPQVALDYGKPSQRFLDHLSITEAKKHLAAGQFPPGSMGPKIEAAIDFLEGGGERVVITD